MSGTTDEIKGRVKEAVGVVTDNERLKNEERLDQIVGKVKKVVERGIDKAKNRKFSSSVRSDRDASVSLSEAAYQSGRGRATIKSPAF